MNLNCVHVFLICILFWLVVYVVSGWIGVAYVFVGFVVMISVIIIKELMNEMV